ncbi:MAG: type II secretion system protein, partial [Limisphaerales bacterium]
MNARFVQRHSWAIGGYMKCLWKGSARDGGQRTSTRPASRLAFTLIELLVVIAVIAILASLL